MNRGSQIPILGELDEEAGEFWIVNPFFIPLSGNNLSAFERNCLFLSCDGQDFVDASFTSGADIDSDSRSVIAADFDGDSAVDLLVGSVGGGPLRMFRNNCPQGRVLRLKLQGTHSNRPAIGARVIVRCGSRQIVRDLFPANGFMGQSPAHEMLIGLGDSEQADEVIIRWPSGREQRLENIPAGRLRTVVEE